MHPILRRIVPHNGVDFAAATGTTLWAAADGEISWAGPKGANGNLVSIRHANGYESHYAHMHRIQRGIAVGVEVRQRQVIGSVGTTGRSTGPHLHFGLKHNGRFVDPLPVLNGPGQLLPAGQLAGYPHLRARHGAAPRAHRDRWGPGSPRGHDRPPPPLPRKATKASISAPCRWTGRVCAGSLRPLMDTATLERRVGYALLALSLSLLVVGLNWSGIWDPWEIDVAEVARSWSEGRSASVDGSPLGPWLTSLSFQLLGVREWTGRLPIALSACSRWRWSMPSVAWVAGAGWACWPWWCAPRRRSS
jgi:hypothetical protein